MTGPWLSSLSDLSQTAEECLSQTGIGYKNYYNRGEIYGFETYIANSLLDT